MQHKKELSFMDNREYFGKKFYLDKKTGYWISTTFTPRCRAHQWVWICIHGTIPKGYHIHHKNGDKSDNTIENLELIQPAAHLIKHMTQERRDQAAKMCETIRPLTKEWHRSPEGIAWHKFHAIKCKFGNGPSFDYQCQQCDKSYKSKLIAEGRTRFCSNACKSKWRRNAGLDNVERICCMCNAIFQINKYTKTVCCTKKCAALMRWI